MAFEKKCHIRTTRYQFQAITTHKVKRTGDEGVGDGRVPLGGHHRHAQPLRALDPGRAGDMMQSLVENARTSGWLPKWPVAAGQTDVMVGDPAGPMLASAFAVAGEDGRMLVSSRTTARFERDIWLRRAGYDAGEEEIFPRANDMNSNSGLR